MKNGKPLILVVEDDRPVQNLITTTLETQGYYYETADNGAQAVFVAASKKPDIILMDLGLPDKDGVEVIEKIRSWAITPIIVISARSDESDKIKALDAGADDYLTKPFGVEELLARLRSTIRRLNYLNNETGVEDTVFHNGNLKIDYSSATVEVEGKEIHLMPMEYSLLCLLAKNVGKVLTYRYILEKVWSNALESDLASLRVYMASLRKKIEPNTHDPIYIQTHIGIGYRMIRTESK